MAYIPKYKYGYVRDPQDTRDFNYKDHTGNWFKRGLRAVLRPSSIDLRSTGMFPETFNQGSLGSCTANATCGGLDYLEKKLHGVTTTLSRLYLYYYSRGGVADDTGATLRDTIKSIQAHGICDEKDWPYDMAIWQQEPSKEAQAKGAKHEKNFKYLRLKSLTEMLDCLAQGFPFVFGIAVFESFENFVGNVVPLPNTAKEAFLGGHALLCVGYDSKKRLFLFRNSWGKEWKDGGYAWIPFDYMLNPQLAGDIWTVKYIEN